MESEGTTLMEAAAAGAEPHSLQELLMLTMPQADVNAQDEKGDTALHAACVNGRVAVVRWLLDNGARLDVRNKEGDTMLHAAASGGVAEIVDMLVDAGFEGVDVQNEDGRTPAHAAVKTGSMEVLLCLVKYGADLKLVAENGVSLLHVAASVDNVDAIKYLVVEAGLGVNLCNKIFRMPLHHAAMCGSVGAIKALLENGAQLEATDHVNQTPLFLAALMGHQSAVEVLLDAGAEVNTAEGDGWMPLHGAAQSGDVETIKLLVERGADLHGRTQDARSVLYVAAASGCFAAVEYLLKIGVDVDAGDDEKRTPLFIAALKGHRSVAKLLINAGANVNAKDKQGWVPLHAATQSSDIEAIKLLVERGANVFSLAQGKRSVLHIAAVSGSVDAAQFFLDNGAAVDARNSEMRTPLFIAVFKGHQSVAKLLINSGADVNAPEKHGAVPLHGAAQLGDVEMIKLLVEHGADVHKLSQNKQSMLYMAAGHGSVEAVKYFLSKGLAVDAADEAMQTPLSIALHQKHRSVVEVLLDAGADVNGVDENGWTPLHSAARADDVEMIELLVERGADTTRQTQSKRNALHIAAMNGSVGAVLHFLGNGSVVDVLDGDKRTPLVIAALKGHQFVVELLLDAGADVNAADKDGWVPLHGAAQSGDVEIIQLLIERGGDLRSQTRQGQSVLHIAAFSSFEAVMFCLDNGLEIDATNEDAETPLFIAAMKGHRSMVEFLLNAGASVNVPDNHGRVPLHAAATSGDVGAIELLINYGADIRSVTRTKQNALHFAAQNGALEAVKYFLDNGLAVDANDKDKRTPLFQAAMKGHLEVVELLLDAGADVNAADKDDWSSLHAAAQSGNVETIKLLVERGADKHSLTQDGKTPLQGAAISGSKEAVEYFISHARNAEVDEINKADKDGYAAIHYAARKGDVDTIQLLLDLGADAHKVSETGWSVLHCAAQGGSVEAIELLLGQGIDINAKDKDGNSVLHMAVYFGKDAAAKLLLERGADANAIDEEKGWPTFLYAADGGSVELLKLFLDSGADPHVLAKDGKTALHVACMNERRAAVEYLVELGIDANAVDHEGRTALHYAAFKRGSGCVLSLLKFGVKESIGVHENDGFLPLHIAARAHLVQETKELLQAGSDVHALTNYDQTPLQLAVFAESSSSAPRTASMLCSFGAQWTTKCEEELMELKAELDASEVDEADERYQELQWCSGLRACVLYWENQYREGTKEFTTVPIEIIQRGEASVRTYLADVASSNADELVYRCKVCVVGPSQWGKTSLVRSIETAKPFLIDIRDRTIGIELVATTLGKVYNKLADDAIDADATPEAVSEENLGAEGPPSPRPKNHEVTFWDFAGQDVYQVAHSLFFSRRTLYVLVIDALAYSDQLDAIKSLRSSAAEAAMNRFLSRYVFRWVRTIFARQPDAEFLVLGTKADLLTDESKQSARVWRDLQSRIYQWKLNYMREIEEEYGVVTKASSMFTGKNTTMGNARRNARVDARIRELTEKLARLASDTWLVVSVTRPNSIEEVRQVVRSTIEASERGFPMWNKYSRVLKAITSMRMAANRPGDGLHRLEHAMMLFRPLCRKLMDEVEGLEYDECREILRTLHDLGDVIWYEHQEAGELRDFVILDPMLVIDIVREVISHEHKKKTGASIENQSETEEKPRIDGRVSHSLLETFPLWKHMDKELMYAFKMLLKYFQLAYPADDEVMNPESDLIVPSYWKVQLEAASSSRGPEAGEEDVEARPNHHCWEYEVSADLADAIFEEFAVQSYTSFMKREVRAHCIESSCPEFDSWITLHPGTSKHDVIRVEVASEDPAISWFNMRYYLMKLEKVLDGYSGLAVPRYVVVDGKRHSLSPATKAIRDSLMMGRAVDDLRAQMPWLPPDLDWFITRAWRDITAFRELQMMHLVRDKLNVLQKLVVKSGSQRQYPALWSLEYDAETHVAVLRMLSDLSGRCYHVPIEIEVPPAFLAKHGSKLKVGVSLFANVLPKLLSAPVVQTALRGAASYLKTNTERATEVHNLIESMDLTASNESITKTSTASGISSRGATAILRDLLKLHNDSLDELSITEISNLECATTSKGEYVWAHAHEIRMLKNELTPCQPRFKSKSLILQGSQPQQEPPPQTTSKLRLNFCIETVVGLADWDWYKTYCTWQLFYGDRKTPLVIGATTTNADNNTQPEWRSTKTMLDAIESVEMLQQCRLVVQVKRRSRIGWTKLIGEGQAELRSLVSMDVKQSFHCDPIEVALQSSGSLLSTKHIVLCQISSTA